MPDQVISQHASLSSSHKTSHQTPPQPEYVLRGHGAQVHSVCFLRRNTRLLTGDADGWVVLWNMASKRAVCVWKPHEAAILGLGSWGEERIITHGRDSKLRVWRLPLAQEHDFSTVLPVDDTTSNRKEPWLDHSLWVNTLNFCAFASCRDQSTDAQTDLLIAVPGLPEGTINVHRLPSEAFVAKIDLAKGTKTGMVMSLKIFYVHDSLHVAAGYEDGSTSLWQPDHEIKAWQRVDSSTGNGQPILSLGISPSYELYFSSGADSVIASHPVSRSHNTKPGKQAQTKHAGQQSLTVRSDGRILATAGWDGRMRVYSAKSLQELAVLKWHKEGCYALDFAIVEPAQHAQDESHNAGSDMTTMMQRTTLGRQRESQASTSHWLAAGSKDGKVSIWDVY